MLGWLKRVDAAEADAQVQRTAAEVQQRVAVERAVAAAHPPPRGPGRPPLKREALSVVAAEPDAADDAVMAADEPGSDTHDHTRRYTQWLTSPLFPLIHAAVCTTRSLRGAVTALHGQSMQVYGALAYGTLQKWYEIDSDGVPQLRERFRRFLSTDVPQRLTGGGGPRSFWDRHPEATNKIRELLMRARDGRNAGIAVGVPLLTWIARGVLNDLQIGGDAPLSHSAMSRFARDIMHWSWRRRTAASSKLPDDWREQGILAARRIVC
jgi:hypothetical protein